MSAHNGAVRTASGGPWRRVCARVTAPVSVAAALLLAGCAASSATPASTATTPAVAAAVESAAAEQYARDIPPTAAQMICSDEIRGEVADALNLASVPAPASAWADHVYTCTYVLPVGRLVLSVGVSPSTTAAGDRLDELRGRLAAAAEEPGLGQRAYSSAPGMVIAVKDNMMLTVDATGLPDDLGAIQESRLDLARVIASGVFDCWTGNS
jgi:hypothetical protein